MEIKNLIDRLDDWDGVDAIYNGEFAKVNHHGVFRLLEEAAAALEQLQTENDRLKKEIQQMRWIPVEERLPETGTVLATDGRVVITAPSSSVTKDGPTITHWMPLPQPPKEATHD